MPMLRTTPNDRQTNPREVDWVEALAALPQQSQDERKVIFWLRSGQRVSGIVESAGTIMRLKEATIGEDERTIKFVLLRAEDIEFISAIPKAKNEATQS